PSLLADIMLERQQQERAALAATGSDKKAYKKAAKAYNNRLIHQELAALNQYITPQIITLYEQTLQSTDFVALAAHLQATYQAQQAARTPATPPAAVSAAAPAPTPHR
ncbi:MAG TPA: hypothetical protein VJJ83_03390, partial [Candidatus Babeliales bacterium]|nr:hypothetical protein [Candidatus Babeliales bacterium]